MIVQDRLIDDIERVNRSDDAWFAVITQERLGGHVEKIKTFEIRAWIAAITAHHGVGGDEKLERRLERLEKGSSTNPSLSQHVRDTSHYDWDDIFKNKQRHPLRDEKRY